jgi:ferrous iron transport protein B
MATRVIENRRDRLATILVAPLMTCSARLPVYTLLIGAFLTAGYAWWLPGLVMFLMYALGLVLAPLVALALKRTLLRGETPVFVLEMPLYKRPGLRTVLGRMFDASWAFLRRAGTIILATMILVWALLYFPTGDGQGGSYPERIDALNKSIAPEKEEIEKLADTIKEKEKELKGAGKVEADTTEKAIADLTKQREELEEEIQPTVEKARSLMQQWKRQTILGWLGRGIEPAVKPLGWDWRVGVATLASFPAREVVVGTLGIVYQGEKVDSEELSQEENLSKHALIVKLRDSTWEGSNRKVFTIPTVLSLMVFFALCCQCASTLAVIRRETRSWRWPLFTFAYMTVLAYLGALVVYQVGSLLV